jgi:hypothetical protein
MCTLKLNELKRECGKVSESVSFCDSVGIARKALNTKFRFSCVPTEIIELPELRKRCVESLERLISQEKTSKEIDDRISVHLIKKNKLLGGNPVYHRVNWNFALGTKDTANAAVKKLVRTAQAALLVIIVKLTLPALWI